MPAEHARVRIIRAVSFVQVPSSESAFVRGPTVGLVRLLRPQNHIGFIAVLLLLQASMMEVVVLILSYQGRRSSLSLKVGWCSRSLALFLIDGIIRPRSEEATSLRPCLRRSIRCLAEFTPRCTTCLMMATAVYWSSSSRYPQSGLVVEDVVTASPNWSLVSLCFPRALKRSDTCDSSIVLCYQSLSHFRGMWFRALAALAHCGLIFSRTRILWCTACCWPLESQLRSERSLAT